MWYQVADSLQAVELRESVRRDRLRPPAAGGDLAGDPRGVDHALPGQVLGERQPGGPGFWQRVAALVRVGQMALLDGNVWHLQNIEWR